MNRRDFLAASSLAAVAPVSHLAATAQQAQEPEYYELRQYHMLYGAKQQQLHDFLREVAIPAMNRIGIERVGAFQVVYGQNQPTLYLLLPHRSLSSVATAARRLADDAVYRREGAAFLNVPLSDPAYLRIESSLFVAFSGMPRLEAPATDRSRIFELRVYESHSEQAARRKVEMFNEGGEIAIFRKTGLTPVFFGEAIVGQRLPNLTYMLTFDDMAARDRAWDAFRVDPDWEKLRQNEYYADTVSTISSLILRPTNYSQV